MRLAQHPVSDDVPHRRVTRLHVLLHPQRHLSRRVLALLHRGELGEGLLDRLGAVLRVVTGSVVLATALSGNFLGCRKRTSSIPVRGKDED
jgi:hypothetical protein